MNLDDMDIDTDPITEAEWTAMHCLASYITPMVVTLELGGSRDQLANSAAALACLSKCVERGFVKHTKIAEASGLFELTPLGRFRYETEAATRRTNGQTRDGAA